MLLTDAGCSNWVTTARSLASLYDINISDNYEIIKLKVRQHFQSYIMDNLNQHIIQDKKLKTYVLFKTTFKFEPYLDVLTNFSVRSNFAKLRLSAHNLQIETGRYDMKKIPRAERYCAYCKSLGIFVLEDEIHFLIQCPLFAKERKIMLEPIFEEFPLTRSLGDRNIFIWLLSQEIDKYVIRLGKFCNEACNLREQNLQLHISKVSTLI